ncbi:hypothetical protein [Salinibacter ruber]|uniref:hypothetical protein n=1 Tax=Salinibacter ruber TaxID=146919 RepID=UPI002168E515|nr:hypothetical protein [Salinibacter ruber]MCS4133672.1 hypothetical protein [Salinibacter ruber]
MASLRDRYTKAIIVREENIRNLYSEISKFSRDTKIEVECSDGISRVFGSLKKLKEFGNPERKSIEEMMISGVGRDSTSIQINGSKPDSLILDYTGENVHISISGDESDVNEIIKIVSDEMDAMRPWYSPIANINFIKVGFVFVGFLFVVAYAAAFILGIESGGSAEETDPATRALGFLIFLLPIGIGIIANWLKLRYFPRTFFSIGHGKRRYQNQSKIRMGVIVAGIVSFFVASLFAAF